MDDTTHPAAAFPAVLDAFGDPRANPRIVAAWHPARGTRRVPGHPRFTRLEVARLRSDGYSLVVLAWHGHRRTMALVSGSARSIWRGIE